MTSTCLSTAMQSMYDKGDDEGATVVLYWSEASNWVLVLKPPVPNHRTYLFDLYAQAGSSGQGGIGMPFSLTTLSPTGELFLWRTWQQNRFEKGCKARSGDPAHKTNTRRADSPSPVVDARSLKGCGLLMGTDKI